MQYAGKKHSPEAYLAESPNFPLHSNKPRVITPLKQSLSREALNKRPSGALSMTPTALRSARSARDGGDVQPPLRLYGGLGHPVMAHRRSWHARQPSQRTKVCYILYPIISESHPNQLIRPCPPADKRLSVCSSMASRTTSNTRSPKTNYAP